MEHIKEALTFDDVLLVPRYSSVLAKRAIAAAFPAAGYGAG